MPKARIIRWDSKDWMLSDLARAHNLKPQTLASRLDRGYELGRALATGLCSLEEAGRRGLQNGWRSHKMT